MLKTEMRNPASTHIDTMSAAEMVRVMQEENMNAARAVGEVADSVADAIERIGERMKKGGRLFYVGCGTSGRLGVLDASECPPTYGVSPELVVGIIAGGERALRFSVEGAEDDAEAGGRDLEARSPGALDSVVGISVAGGAAYVLGAVRAASKHGALTVALTCNAGSPLSQACDIQIVTDTGAEVVTGSSRMKAGSAHKMVLNMISTGVMIKLGNVYENYMINLRPTNLKLRGRMIRITSEVAGIGADEAEKRLEAAGWSIPRALGAKDGRLKTDG